LLAAAGFAAGGEGGGVGSAAGFLVSSEPTWSFPLYFLRMPSLWYFQNCWLASLPATRVRIFLPPRQRRHQLDPRVRAKGRANTWMFILELGEVVDVLVDDDVEVGGLVMRCDIALGESFGHGEGMKRSI